MLSSGNAGNLHTREGQTFRECFRLPYQLYEILVNDVKNSGIFGAEESAAGQKACPVEIKVISATSACKVPRPRVLMAPNTFISTGHAFFPAALSSAPKMPEFLTSFTSISYSWYGNRKHCLNVCPSLVWRFPAFPLLSIFPHLLAHQSTPSFLLPAHPLLRRPATNCARAYCKSSIWLDAATAAAAAAATAIRVYSCCSS
jgi:hypothetical protein